MNECRGGEEFSTHPLSLSPLFNLSPQSQRPRTSRKAKPRFEPRQDPLNANYEMYIIRRRVSDTATFKGQLHNISIHKLAVNFLFLLQAQQQRHLAWYVQRCLSLGWLAVWRLFYESTDGIYLSARFYFYGPRRANLRHLIRSEDYII